MKQIKHMILLCLFCLTGIAAQAQEKGPASNEIWYTATAKLAEVTGTGSTAGLHYEVFKDADDKTLTMKSHTWEEAIGKGVITFDGGIATVGGNAFRSCSALSSITIPASVTSIGKQAFNSCYNNSSKKTGLTEVTFAEGSKLETIGESAFNGCKVLSSITIPASVTSIGKQAFYGCTKLETVTFAKGSKLETIGESAFNGCKVLSSITIQASVTSIGNFAFQYCYALESINIPASVTSFGWAPFNGCTGLEAISVDAGNPVFSSPDGCNAIIETAKNTLIQGCKNTVIPESVKIIGTYAFQNMATLESIDIPASVTSISSCAFQFCDKLKSVTIPASSVLESLGSNAFGTCKALESINIPASVTSLEDYTFNFCSNLKSVTVNWAEADKIVQINSKVFKDVYEGMTLIVPAGTESLYAAATGWSSYAEKMKVYITANQDPNNKKDYYATFYSSSKAYKLPTEDVTAYTGAVDGSVLKLKPIADGIIPAGEGVVLKLTSTDDTEAKVNILVEKSTEAGTKDTENVLTGTDTAIDSAPAGTKAFSLGESGVGFYLWTGKPIGAHKAYIPAATQE